MKLREIAGELLKSVQLQLQGEAFPETGLNEEDTFPIRGAILGAMKTTATANKGLFPLSHFGHANERMHPQ